MKKCGRCKKSYHPASGHNFYCDECRRKHANERTRAKWREGMRTGILFGRPIAEVIYDRYKKGAAKREMVFDLSFSDFMELWQKPCTYCGQDIQTIGIDRQDSAIGYTVSNVVPCCTVCNLSKRAMSAEDYIAHCRMVASHSYP